ncbi:anaerobic ribonucleoside-triphosphate reductase [Arabiibacter massiliensis]|uniref:anaerobic ribonucleoside-triphosphate reductase n=1 Tax=Arabiibacter massiliensis TaxID=1870985 RepID=UPI0009B99761|nr:anaerobic ribonucleoside-triphosphate reductase [Arabiibacter massiliensis]
MATAVETMVKRATAQWEQRTVDSVVVKITYLNEDDAPVGDDEIRSYIARGNEQHPNSMVTALELDVDGADVDIRYELAPVPFDRIRRITGYLVGTMDRWNDAKTAEESDRVKHGVTREERAFNCSNGC